MLWKGGVREALPSNFIPWLYFSLQLKRSSNSSASHIRSTQIHLVNNANNYRLIVCHHLCNEWCFPLSLAQRCLRLKINLPAFHRQWWSFQCLPGQGSWGLLNRSHWHLKGRLWPSPVDFVHVLPKSWLAGRTSWNQPHLPFWPVLSLPNQDQSDSDINSRVKSAASDLNLDLSTTVWYRIQFLF